MIQHNSRTGSSYGWSNSGTPTMRLLGGLVGCTQKLTVYEQDGSDYKSALIDNSNIQNNVYNDYVALPNYKQFNRNDNSTSVRIAIKIGAMHSIYEGDYTIRDYMDNAFKRNLSNDIWQATRVNKQWSFDAIVPYSE